jgi:predicted TIM-barrel fold metal-dependent hydrolase
MIKTTGQIVDSLTHITPDGCWFSTTADASEKMLLSQMDENRIEKSVVVGLAGHISNQFVLSACQRHSDRLLPVASFNPIQYAETKTVAKEARKQLDRQGFIGLKLHPRLNQYDPLDPHVLSLLDEIAGWKTPLPIWLCTYFYYQGAALRKPAVDTIFELVSRYPTIPFMLAHAGGPDILRLAYVVRHCPNAFLDLSFTLSRYLGSSVETDIRYLINTFEKRLIFGSDFPEISQGQALTDFRGLAGNTKPGALERVLGINLLEILEQVAAGSVKI